MSPIVKLCGPAMIARWLDSIGPNAKRQYRRSLARFSTWAIGPGAALHDGMQVLIEAGAGPAHAMVKGWRDDLLRSGLKTESVTSMITPLGSLVGHCRRAGLCDWSLRGVAPRAKPREDRSAPARGDVERLVAFVDHEAAKGDRRATRDAAILRLIFSAGLRRFEVGNLRFEDIEIRASVVKPRCMMKPERQAVLVSAGTVAALQRWVAVRGTEPGWLFVRTDRPDASRPISGETIRRLLRSWTKRAGIRGTIRPHGLRHSGATEIAARAAALRLAALDLPEALS